MPVEIEVVIMIKDIAMSPVDVIDKILNQVIKVVLGILGHIEENVQMVGHSYEMNRGNEWESLLPVDNCPLDMMSEAERLGDCVDFAVDDASLYEAEVGNAGMLHQSDHIDSRGMVVVPERALTIAQGLGLALVCPVKLQVRNHRQRLKG